MKFIVIGITDNPQPSFLPEVLEIIKSGKVFSGGKRHHEIVAPFLPANAQWIDITVPLNAVFEQYHDEVVVFASGDPLFFGFANTLQREFPDAELKVFVTASAEVRAQRRYDELKAKGMPADFDDILKNVQ
jgi:precorrin-6Y C5,15-methyltransferase (decarboxylating)